MSEEIQTIDSLYKDEVPVTPDPQSDPAPSNLTPDTPPADTPPASSTPPADDTPPSTDTRPGMERYLAEYGIEGGMIAFEDGEKVHIDDLTPEEQHVVLNSLASKARPTVEQALDLSEDEVSFLNMVRESGKGVSDMVADLANTQLDKIRNFEESQSINFDEMSDDAIYLAFLQGKDTTLTEEQLEEDLDKAKETRTYETVVKGLREEFKQTQDRTKKEEEFKASEKIDKEVEQDRVTIVGDVANIKEVAGFEITDDHKNELLGSILELNDVGDSLLLEEIFSTPKTIFEAAWFQKYGKAAINNMEIYWKQEASKAYSRGRAEALGKLPESSMAPRISGIRNRANQEVKLEFNTAPDAKTLDDLYDD